MAKIHGLFGAMSGKVADVVMVVRNGQQIVRKYQPIVMNPRTEKQLSTRAALKLSSQLARVMAPYSTFTREGSVSKRNVFAKRNYSSILRGEGVASAHMPDIVLTDGALPALSLSDFQRGTSESHAHAIALSHVDAVVGVAFARSADGVLYFLGSALGEPASDNNGWEINIPAVTAEETFIYAYGVVFRDGAVGERYGSLLVSSSIASLISSRILSNDNADFTATSCIVGEGVAESYSVQAFPNVPSMGSVSQSTDEQTHRVTLTATATEGNYFAYWRKSGTSETFSTSNPLSILPVEDITIWAVFAPGEEISQ